MEYTVYKTRTSRQKMGNAIQKAGFARAAKLSLLWTPWMFEIVSHKRMEEYMSASDSGETTLLSRPGTQPVGSIEEAARSLGASSWYSPQGATYVSFVPETGDEFERLGDKVIQTQIVLDNELKRLETLAAHYSTKRV